MGCQDNAPPYGHSIVCTDQGRHREMPLGHFTKGYMTGLGDDDLEGPAMWWVLYGEWREGTGQPPEPGRRFRKPTALKERYEWTCKRLQAPAAGEA